MTTGSNAVTGRPHPWPRGLLGMLVLIAVVEQVIAGRHLDFTTVAADDWRRTGEAASTKAVGRDVLCLGDSLVKYGILPRVIEANTGLTAFNLAINAGPMPAEYYLLKRALAAGARPRAIVADFFPLMLADQPRGSIRVYPELVTVADAVDLAWTVGDTDLLASILVGKLLPSVRCRFEIRANLTALVQGRWVSPRLLADRRVWTAWKEELGAQPMPDDPAGPLQNPALIAGLFPAGWTCDPINATYFERFLDLADAEQVPVFWVMPPLGPEVRAGRVAWGIDAAYARFAQAAQARHPVLVVLDARGANYDGSAYFDPIHLNAAGAQILSGDVARVLADRLVGRSAAHWVDLPAHIGRIEPGPDPAQTARKGRPRATR